MLKHKHISTVQESIFITVIFAVGVGIFALNVYFKNYYFIAINVFIYIAGRLFRSIRNKPFEFSQELALFFVSTFICQFVIANLNFVRQYGGHENVSRMLNSTVSAYSAGIFIVFLLFYITYLIIKKRSVKLAIKNRQSYHNLIMANFVFLSVLLYSTGLLNHIFRFLLSYETITFFIMGAPITYSVMLCAGYADSDYLHW